MPKPRGERDPGWPAVVHRCVPAAVLVLLLAAPARGQVVFDDSLGPPGPAPSAPGVDFLIEQNRGQLRGTNLFHSFSEFSIPAGLRAEFTAVDPVDNVIARVTGGSMSRINGTLASSIPGADLFLLNPGGVVFGQTATLDVLGSFHVATADSLVFPDGELVVAELDDPVLSTYPPAAFGFLPGDAEDVTFALADPTIDTEAIEVAPGSTLTAVGGDVSLGNRGNFLAAGGVIQLAAVGEAGVEVPVDVATFDASNTAGLGDVRIENAVTIDTLALGTPDADQGRVVIRGQSLGVDHSFVYAGGDGAPGSLAIDVDVAGPATISGDGSLLSFGAGSGATGGVRVSAGQVRVSESFVAVQSFGTGVGGSLDVTTASLEVVDARIVSESFGSGGSGPLSIRATDSVSVGGVSEIATESVNGAGGALSIETGDLFARDGGQISTTTNGSGPAGPLSIQARGDVVLSGVGGTPANPVPSGVFARSGSGIGTPATGDGGDLSVSARNLELTNGAVISARTFGSGNAGDVTIDALDRVRIAESSQISAGGLSGDGGSIGVTARVVEVQSGGQIVASTAGSGSSGDVSLDASEVTVSGRSTAGGRSTIATETRLLDEQGSGGDAGTIDIAADDFLLADGGRVTTRSAGSGQPNRITIEARDSLRIDGGELRSVAESPTASVTGGDILLTSNGDITLQNDALVNAQALGSGDAGNIAMQAAGRLDLNRSQVTTEARLALGGNIALEGGSRLTLTRSEITTSVQQGNGTGGNIDLGPRQVSLNASTVLAQAFEGEGGDIRVDASDSYLESSDSRVDASATAEIGVDGTFVVDAPESDLASELARLPETFLDASQLLQRDCEIRTERAGSFVVQGALLPPSPDAALDPERLEPSGAPPCERR